MAAKNCQPNLADMPKAIRRSVLEIDRLRQRQDFIKVKKGARSHERAFVLQLLARADDTVPAHVLRVGFTVTKKNGNAVFRNKIKRRLREAVRIAAIPDGAAGHDGVLVARPLAASLPFDELVASVSRSFEVALCGKRRSNGKSDKKLPSHVAKTGHTGQKPPSGR